MYQISFDNITKKYYLLININGVNQKIYHGFDNVDFKTKS